MYRLIRPLLFALDPETAHTLALKALNYLPSCAKPPVSSPITVMGLNFSHRIGLAAGLDKNAEYLDGLAKLGFAFIEVGTVTPRAQAGNAQPRLFRLPEAQAIINRMGFNNQGVDQLVRNIQQSQYSGILGINIGKNKETSLNHAVDDYLLCLKKVYRYASYIAINISSPNTPNLRQLQQEHFFKDLLQALRNAQLQLADQYLRYVPLVIKISPDEDPETIKNMANDLLACQIDGVIATNTTCRRDGIQQHPLAKEQGGLSGRPLQHLATQSLAVFKQYVGEAITLIGVGGIEDVLTARAKLTAGAQLVQIYTGLIYQGPGLVKQLAKRI